MRRGRSARPALQACFLIPCKLQPNLSVFRSFQTSWRHRRRWWWSSAARPGRHLLRRRRRTVDGLYLITHWALMAAHWTSMLFSVWRFLVSDSNRIFLYIFFNEFCSLVWFLRLVVGLGGLLVHMFRATGVGCYLKIENVKFRFFCFVLSFNLYVEGFDSIWLGNK